MGAPAPVVPWSTTKSHMSTLVLVQGGEKERESLVGQPHVPGHFAHTHALRARALRAAAFSPPVRWPAPPDIYSKYVVYTEHVAHGEYTRQVLRPGASSGVPSGASQAMPSPG